MGRKPTHQPSRMMTWRGGELLLWLMGFHDEEGRRSPWPEKRALSYWGRSVCSWRRREEKTDLRRGMSWVPEMVKL